MFKLLYFLLKIVALVFLPFLILLRVSIFTHSHYDLAPTFALSCGAVATAFALMIYFSFFYGKLTGKIGSFDAFKRRSSLALFIVLGFVAYALFYINGSNVKHQAIKKEFSELHPIIRIGIASIVLFDKNMIITDASRVPEDYKKMGLKTSNSSLHYKQKDGYAYAVDLRTKGRLEWANQLRQIYFRLMGFNVLRHTGTADHLHLSLSCKYRRGAI